MKPKHKHTPNPPRFFNLLRTRRKQLGLTQHDVAVLMGLASSAHISEYEHGGKSPSFLRLIDVSIILHEPRLDALFPDLYDHRRQQIIARRMSLQSNIDG